MPLAQGATLTSVRNLRWMDGRLEMLLAHIWPGEDYKKSGWVTVPMASSAAPEASRPCSECATLKAALADALSKLNITKKALVRIRDNCFLGETPAVLRRLAGSILQDLDNNPQEK